MRILSLFDGISCGQLALKRANIPVEKYYACELDKYAIKITQKNHPNTIQLGDINNWQSWDIDFKNIDLIFAGFPCQAWSMSGKQKGDNDPRGVLVHVLIDLWTHIKKINPKVKFLFENVKMKKDFLNYINNLFDTKPVLINSALVSAQNRQRYYWTNINNSNISQPLNKCIYLKDILEHDVTDRDKSYCIDANYFKGGNLEQYFKKSRRQLIFEKSEKICNIGKGGQGQRVYDTNGKSVTINANGGGQGAKTGLYCVAQRGRHIIAGKRKDIKGAKTEQRFEARFDEKTNCLTTVQKDNYILEIDGCEYVVRKLTPIECERLQTLPDNYTAGVSNTQRYKMLGNGWTVDVIAHILSKWDLNK